MLQGRILVTEADAHFVSAAIEDRNDDAVGGKLDGRPALQPSSTIQEKDSDTSHSETPSIPLPAADSHGMTDTKKAAFRKDISQQDPLTARSADINDAASNGILEEESDRGGNAKKVVV